MASLPIADEQQLVGLPSGMILNMNHVAFVAARPDSWGSRVLNEGTE